jgi:hypothetical protein
MQGRMMLAGIECRPASDLSTFECLKCNPVEISVIAFKSNAAG